MELQKLRTLVVLSQSARFTDAAEQLYMTQSNVTKQVQSLERELGVTLVERGGRRLALTPAGERVVRSARLILAEYDAMCRSLQANRGMLTIACIPVMAQYNVTKLFADFQRAFPQTTLVVEEREDNALLDRVRQGRWELAVCRTDQDCDGIDKLVLYRDRLSVALPAGHPLAGDAAISLARLRRERFLQLGPTSTLYRVVLDACQAAGFSPLIAYTSTRMENLLSLVREGNGVSLLMGHAASYLHTPDVVIRPLQERVVSELSLARAAHARRSPAARSFWTYAKEWIHRNRPAADALSE